MFLGMEHEKAAYVDADFFGMPNGTKATPLGGGRNSQVFLLEPPGRGPLVFKRYFVDPRDKRDRQGTEARALKFLEQAGVMESPLLLTLDTDRQASMLSLVEGEKVTGPTLEDMELAGSFIVRLIELSGSEQAVAAGFNPASEAFFSAAGVVENIETRLARLDGVNDDCPLCRELTDYLNNQLRPAFSQYVQSCEELLEVAGMSMDKEIPEAWRILSPSDFGLHNSLRRPDGGLSFFDYEYFGWDDPSKVLADFCLHPAPAMNLPAPMQERFIRTVLPALKSLGYRPERAAAMFPLFAIKWCCILLNEFVPREAARRNFAKTAGSEGRDRVLVRQLDKARNMLGRLGERAATFARFMA